VLLVLAALIFLGGTVLAGSAQLNELTPAQEEARRASFDPVTGDYVCQQQGTVTYCAYAGYEGWIPEWASQVGPVLALIPEAVATRPLEIRQQIPYFNDGEELPQVGDIAAGMWWSRRPYDSSLVAHPLGMSLAAAGWAVGFPADELPVRVTVVDNELVTEPVDDPTAVDPDELQYRSCQADGQARAVAALWYATQTSPESAEGLRFLISDQRHEGLAASENIAIDLGYRQPASSVIYFRKEALIALDLGRLPSDEVRDTLTARWNQVADPSTTTEEIAGWFGLSVQSFDPRPELDTIPCP
jgi:hypothetical protein